MLLASRYYICHLGEESDSHLFFCCSLATAFWSWLVHLWHRSLPGPLSIATIWKVFSKVGDGSGRKCAAAIFFLSISILWHLWNEAKHSNRKASLQSAKAIFVDIINGMIISMSKGTTLVYPHPILQSLGIWLSLCPKGQLLMASGVSRRVWLKIENFFSGYAG